VLFRSVNILKGKSKPYLMKAKMAQTRSQELYSTSGALNQLANDYKVARPEVQKLLNREMTILDRLSGSGKMKSAVSDALNSSPVSEKELLSARKTVSEDPENTKEILKLKFIETKIGHPLMPSYLEARLNQIQRGKSL